ncbi:MAG: sulfatase-like hydrolase/transferase [Gammaproteobacteria bacterium]|nr:sulfatase-like hydrolase/transferase [Gammaproteobacteria bacterium]
MSSIPWQARFKTLSLLFVLIGLVMVINNNTLPFKNAKETYKAGQKPPLLTLFKNLKQEVVTTASPEPVSLTIEDLAVAKRYGIAINPNTDKPFEKPWIYEHDAFNLENKQWNVILLFVESLSSQLSGVYRPEYAHLTPNLLNFAQHSTVVKGYYNHVTPTIVSLRGGLCSMFPYKQLTDWRKVTFAPKSESLRCLPTLLSENGYRTHFFSYAHPNETFVEQQMQASGFEDTQFYQQFLDRHVDSEQRPTRRTYGNGDQQMFTGLINFLSRNQSSEPFFVAMSTLETHPGLSLLEGQTRYPNIDNDKLNLVHNLDDAFGRFWRAFQSSSLASNTIVIVTADHAHTASIPLKAVAKADYSGENFDEVVLQIYHPSANLPATLTVEASSLDLAPTILQLVGIRDAQNSFLGRSILGDRQLTDGAIGSIYNQSQFITTRSGVLKQENLEQSCLIEGQTNDLCALNRVIRQSHYLQSQGRF